MIELHDSEVQSLIVDGKDIHIRFSKAYVHRFVERPGEKSHTGWVRPVLVVIHDGTIEGELPSFEDEPHLYRGNFKDADGDHGGVLPLSRVSTGSVRLWLQFIDGEELTIKGAGCSVHLLGEARFVKDIPED